MPADRAKLFQNAELLRQSPLVVRIVAEFTRERKDGLRQKIRVELSNGWLMDCWEHIAPGHRRFAYHIFDAAGMVVRWGNAPHHPEGGTFPHHRHTRTGITDSEDMDLAKALRQLAGLM